MAYQAVIFDMGNTLVHYWRADEWPALLDRAITAVADYLNARGLLRVGPEEIAAVVRSERAQSGGIDFRPLAGRLGGIFRLSPADLADGRGDAICRLFMAPLFALGRVYDDVVPVLEALRDRGLKTALLSNSPWGSPPVVWHEEMARLGLAGKLDLMVFCGEVGRRKPAPDGFEHVCERLGVPPSGCLFVGDDPRWDVVGPRGVGMDAVLIDRFAETPANPGEVIHGLAELMDLI